MADNALLDALMKLLGRSPQQPADPNAGINPDRPWDSQVLQPPVAPPVQPTPAPATPQPLLAPQNPGGPTTPSDQALIEAIRRKQMNQQFAGATGNPIPR